MNNPSLIRTSPTRSPRTFFVLVFALSIPISLAGGVIGLELLPGLPMSSLIVTFCPLLAALILVYREDKAVGVAGLLRRAFDYKRIRSRIWYIPVFLLMPGVMALSFGLMRLLGSPVPIPQFPVLALPTLFLVFFVAALGEELGWMGYAIDPLQDRSNALQASLLLGLAWAAWHIIPVVQAGRSPIWIASQCLFWVASRVLSVWLYNNTGKSVFATVVYHAMLNVTWQLFPVNGSFYDPRITGLIVACVAAIVAVIWGPKTLARDRFIQTRYEKERTMTKQKDIVKGKTLQVFVRAGLIIAVILTALVGLLMLPVDNLGLYASHPNPAADYAEAVQRVESLRLAEVGFNPDCHTILFTHGAKTAKAIVFVDGFGSCPASFKELGTQFYDLGYNVLVAPLPYNGLADRMTTEQAKLRAEDLVRYTDQVVDIGRGLGDHLTLAGISAGGLMTGWAAQQRQDVDLAVLISPGFGFQVVPERLTLLVSRASILLPNLFIWNDPVLKADAPPKHNYPRLSTRAVLGQILRLSLATQALARQKAPVASSILVVTNLNEPGVDNVVTGKVVDVWRAYPGTDVQTYQFPEELHLPHGLIDVQEPDQNVAAVYPKLLELIYR